MIVLLPHCSGWLFLSLIAQLVSNRALCKVWGKRTWSDVAVKVVFWQGGRLDGESCWSPYDNLDTPAFSLRIFVNPVQNFESCFNNKCSYCDGGVLFCSSNPLTKSERPCVSWAVEKEFMKSALTSQEIVWSSKSNTVWSAESCGVFPGARKFTSLPVVGLALDHAISLWLSGPVRRAGFSAGCGSG